MTRMLKENDQQAEEYFYKKAIQAYGDSYDFDLTIRSEDGAFSTRRTHNRQPELPRRGCFSRQGFFDPYD